MKELLEDMKGVLNRQLTAHLDRVANESSRVGSIPESFLAGRQEARWNGIANDVILESDSLARFRIF